MTLIRERLENDKTPKKRTNPKVDIVELLKFILETTCFRFEGEIYQQKFGVAMGSPVPPIVVNLFMEGGLGSWRKKSLPRPQMIASQGTGSGMWMMSFV